MSKKQNLIIRLEAITGKAKINKKGMGRGIGSYTRGKGEVQRNRSIPTTSRIVNLYLRHPKGLGLAR